MNKRMSNNKYVIVLLCYCVFKNMILCQKRNMFLRPFGSKRAKLERLCL